MAMKAKMKETPHFFPLPFWFFGGPFPFPFGLHFAVNAAIVCVSLMVCGDGAVAFFF